MRHLDGHPIVAHPNSPTPLAVISRCGTYMVTGHQGSSTITITNLISKTPPQLVHTDMEIVTLAITSNILLVFDTGKIVAWQLTEEGAVYGVPASRSVGYCNSIWAKLTYDCNPLHFIFQGQSITIMGRGGIVHIYHAATSEVPESAQQISKYSPWDMYRGRHYHHYHKTAEQDPRPEDGWLVPVVSSQVVWVRNPERRHRLWVPIELRRCNARWLQGIRTLCLSREDLQGIRTLSVNHEDESGIVIKL